MLVYLDTSHFDMLERLCHKDLARFARFIERWTMSDHFLALTLEHAQELAQLSEETSRQRRLNVIYQFPYDQIRFSLRGAAGLLDVELIIEIRALAGGRQVPIEEIQQFLFDGSLDDFTKIVVEHGDSMRLRR